MSILYDLIKGLALVDYQILEVHFDRFPANIVVNDFTGTLVTVGEATWFDLVVQSIAPCKTYVENRS